MARHPGDLRHGNGGYGDSYYNHRNHPRGGPFRYPDSTAMTGFEDEEDGSIRRRRRGNSPSSYRVGIDSGGDAGDRRREFESPSQYDVSGGGGGFRTMNGPPGGGNFQQMDPSGRGGGFRPTGLGEFPASRGRGGGRYDGGDSGIVMGFQARSGVVGGSESEYSLRPMPSPVAQQPLSGKKRSFPSAEPGTSPRPNPFDRSNTIKLFVGSVPRTAREEDIRPFFDRHGNVLEVALIKDKRTGQQQGCCFVKYATSEDADRAIRALHNQIVLPGGVSPIQVRYADGERERLGAQEFKLFVGSVNKQATEKDIEEIFSQYGRVEDVYLMRDEYRQSRGCGFVKYSNKEMAMAAINGLNGAFTMSGCNQPLIVRFADPKRPKPGESRDTVPAGGPDSGPRFQPPGPRPPSGDGVQTNPWHPMNSPKTRPPRGFGTEFPPPRPGGQATLPSNAGGPSGGYAVPPLNPLPIPAVSSSSSLQQRIPVGSQQVSPLQKSAQSPQDAPRVTSGQVGLSQAAAVPQAPYGYSNHLPASQPPHQQSISPATVPQAPLYINLRPNHVSSAPEPLPAHAQPQPLQQMQHPPSHLAQLLSQQTQTLQATFQSSQQAFSQLQQQLQSMQQPNQSSSFPQNGQTGKQQWPVTTTGATPVGDVSSAAPTINQSAAHVRCIWTEHTSPDGFPYYFNGLTGESKWEKPEELVQYEQQMQRKQQSQPQLHQQVTQQPQQAPQLQTQYHSHHPLQHPSYPSSYPMPGTGQNPQYPTSGVGQNVQYRPMSGISQNAQYPTSGVGQNAQIAGGAASIKDPAASARIQQNYQSSALDFTWKNKASGT